MPTPFSHTTRALARDSATPALWAWGIAAIALLVWGGWFFAGRVSVVEVSHKARLEVRQAAHAVNAPLAGTLAAALPALGAEATAGDVLIELDSGTLVLRLREEQARRDGLAAQITSLEQEITARERAAGLDRQSAAAAAQAARFRTAEAATAAAFAAGQEQRLAAAAASGGVAQVEVLQARTEAQKLAALHEALGADARRGDADAQARGAQQQAQLDALRRQLATLVADAEASGVTVQRLALEVEKHRIRAPVSGRVGTVAAAHVGEFVAAGQQLLTVIPAGELIAVAQFEPAAVLGRVQAGQRAQLRLDGFPWAQYGTVAATVSRVAGEIRDGQVRVEFTPDAAWPAGVLRQHGLPGTVEVSLETVAPATLLLRTAGQRLFGVAPQQAAVRAADGS